MKALSIHCDHHHDDRCPRCEDLKSTLKEIEEALTNETLLSQDERDDLLYSFRIAKEAIAAWKAHQLRSFQQDQARTDVLDSLDESSVLITQDWAMKWLPQRYRETQADWFGKRGISWHISVVVRRVDGDLQQQTFVHIVEDCNQDAGNVVQLLRQTLKALKKEHPEIKTASLRQDNAGCYHSAYMLSSCRLMGDDTGIKVNRVEFSDPQGGKGACDRKAAAIKAHVRRYLNEGHNVATARDFEQSMLSYGGTSGVRVALVSAQGSAKPSQESATRWEAINSLNNFVYSDNSEVTVYKAYNTGDGLLTP